MEVVISRYQFCYYANDIYPRHLQTALDDMLWPEGRLRQLELDSNMSQGSREVVVGFVEGRELVVNGNGAAVDLSQLNKRELH